MAEHRSSALRVAAVILGTSTGADDVVQEASLRAWRAIGGLDAERGFRAWYLRIVANSARNDRRSQGRRAMLALRAAGQAAPTVEVPEDAAVTTAEREMVLRGFNALGADDRLVLALRHFEQLTEREMAEVLGCAPGTVKSRLSRAGVRLRDRLGAMGGDDDSGTAVHEEDAT